MSSSKDLDIDLDDDWGLDDDLDLDMDFEPGTTPLPEGREAVLQAPKTAAKKAAETIVGKSKRRKLILDSLPSDYTVAAEAYDTVASEGRKVYQEAKTQLTQTKRDLQRTTREAMPMLQRYLPESMTKKIGNWAKGEEEYTGGYGNEDPRENALAAMLTDTFGAQQELAQQERAEDKVQQDIKDQADTIRQDDLNKIISGIRSDTANMVAYNQVSDKYRRKMLEVNWRQYYVLSDLLQTTQTAMEKLIPNSDAIVKNTALPDYAKEEFSEISAAMMKRTIIENSTPAKFAREYLSKLGDNSVQAIKEFGSSAREVISMGSQVAAMQDDGSQGVELSPAQQRAQMAQTGAELAGSAFANRYITPQVQKIQKYLREKGEANETVASLGSKLRYYGTTMPEYLNDLARDAYAERNSGFESIAANMLSSILPSYTGDTARMENVTAEALAKASPWSKRNDITLNEVIPEWLATIDQSINRLGGVDTGKQTYDWTTKSLVNESEIQERIATRAADVETREYVRKGIDELVEKLTKDADLSDGAKEDLGRVIDEKIRTVGRFNVADLADNMDTYGSVGNSEHLLDLQQFFSDIRDEGKKTEQSVNVEVSDEIRRLRDAIAPIQDVVDEMSNLYGGTMVAKSGIFEHENGRSTLNRDLTSTYSNYTPKFEHQPKPELRSGSNIEEIIKGLADTLNRQEAQRPTTNVDMEELKKAVRSNSARPVAESIRSEDLSDLRDSSWFSNEIQFEMYSKLTDALDRTSGFDMSSLATGITGGVREALFGEEEPNLMTALRKIAKDNESGDSSSTLDGLVEQVRDQLVANNLSEEVGSILQVLQDMSERGVPVVDVSGDAEATTADKPGYFGRFGQHVKSGAGKVRRGAGRVKDAISDRLTKVREKIPSFSVWDKLNGARKGVAAGLNSMADSFQGVTDIRDEDGNIVLLGRKLKAGMYFDENGKVIKSIKDITGAVYDKNGVVLTEEEVREKKDQFTYYTQKGWKKLSEGIGRLAGGGLRNAFGVPQAILSQVSDLGKKVINKVRTSKDIYVQGESAPRLQHQLMLRGFYIDRNTGKVIRSAADITGPVYNKHKEVIISQEDFDNPDVKFVDVDGNPFESLMSKVGSRIKSAVNFGMDKAVAAKDFVKDLAGGAVDRLGAAKDWALGKIRGDGAEKVGRRSTNKIIDKLDEIYQLLDDRLTKQDSKMEDVLDPIDSDKSEEIFGDVDGDGDRDGSFKDIFEKRREAREKKKAERAEARRNKKDAKGEKKPSQGFFSWLAGGLGGALKGVMGSLGGVLAGSFATKALGMLGDGLGSIFNKINPFGGSPDVPDGPGKGKKPGLLKRAAGGLWKGAKALGRGALTAGSFIGRQVLWQGARMAGAAALGAIGTISAPVVLTAAAVAAVGYGAYKLATRVVNGPLMKLRMAQYGTEDYSDGKSDEVAKLLYLEDALLKHTSYNNEGISTVKGVDEQTTMEMAKQFGVATDEPKAVEMFERWVHGRFIPVFLLWTTRARQQAPGVALNNLDDTSKVEPEAMAKILDGVKLPVDHPIFRVMHSPFGDRGMFDTIGGWFGGDDMMSGEAVKEVEAESAEEIAELVKDAKKDKKSNSGKVATVEGADANSADGIDPEWYKLSKDNVVKNDDGSVTVGGKNFRDMKTYRKVRDAYRRRDESTGGNAGTIALKQNADGDFTSLRDPSNLNAVESVRLRAYGLHDLSVDKVKLLWGLEETVIKHISATGKSATINLDSTIIAERFMAKFGLNYEDSAHRAKWKSWFESRFIPVLMRYVISLKQYAANADPLQAMVSTSTPYMLDVALAIVGLRTMFENSEVSIWSVNVSPFKDISSLNGDPTSVDGNIQYLRDNQRRAKAMEQTAGQDEEIRMDTTEVKQVTKPKPKSSGTEMSRSIIDRVRNGSTMSMDSGSGTVTTSAGGTYRPDAGGIPIGEMGEGVDPNSAYAKIRLRGNDKESVANMIKEVSKASGVDENLLLTVAMMESSMNPQAGASTSSAKGLFQFINGTWKAELKKHANKYGIPATAGPFDPVANALLGAEYLRSGAKTVEKAMPDGVKAGPADLYLAHFLGPGGASKFLRNLYKTPDRIAAEDFMQPAASNPGVFTDKGRLLSYRAIHEKLQRRAENRFSYVSKYASNPVLKQAPMAAANDDAKNVKEATPNVVGTDEGRTQIAKVKATKDIEKAVTQRTAVEAAPTSIGSSAVPTPAISEVVKTSVKEMETQTPDFDANKYVDQVRQELDARISSKERELSDLKESMAKHSVEENEKSRTLMEKQLSFLEEMAMSLRQLNEKVGFNGSGREAEQRSRAHQQERQRMAQTITHDRGPISMARQRT